MEAKGFACKDANFHTARQKCTHELDACNHGYFYTARLNSGQRAKMPVKYSLDFRPGANLYTVQLTQHLAEKLHLSSL